MSNRAPGCQAYTRGDQLFCDRCGVTWDMNDNEPPECKPSRVARLILENSTYGAPGKDETVHRAIGNKALTAIKENLNRE